MTEGHAEIPGHGAGGSTQVLPGKPSDLFRLGLREETREPARFLAWTNSVCLLFLIVGVVGFWPPPIRMQTIRQELAPVPVQWTAPEPARPVSPSEVKETGERAVPSEALEAAGEMTGGMPEVAPVTSVIIPGKIEFPVITGHAQQTPGPDSANEPGQHYVPPRPIAFQPGGAGAGAFTPPPEYPPRALRNGREGTVVIEFTVHHGGQVHSAKVRTSSGYPDLDDAALAVVRDKWRLAPGSPRSYFWACTFQIKNSEK